MAPAIGKAHFYDSAPVASSNIGIGIDLGTTYSCVGIFRDDRIEIIANDQGNRITPSYVAFTDTERLIGDAAKNQAALNPENTIFDVKVRTTSTQNSKQQRTKKHVNTHSPRKEEERARKQRELWLTLFFIILL